MGDNKLKRFLFNALPIGVLIVVAVSYVCKTLPSKEVLKHNKAVIAAEAKKVK